MMRPLLVLSDEDDPEIMFGVRQIRMGTEHAMLLLKRGIWDMAKLRNAAAKASSWLPPAAEMVLALSRGSSRMNQQALSAFIWSVADLLRGDYKPADYGKVILPFTVLRRLDCVLAPTKAEVLAEYERRSKAGLNPEPLLKRKAGQSFFNTSTMDLKELLGDAGNVGPNLHSYIQGFSPPRCATSSIGLSSPFRSTIWPKPSCSIRWQRNSRTSTSIRTVCPTARWAWSSRS